jgi:hypothetical protein
MHGLIRSECPLLPTPELKRRQPSHKPEECVIANNNSSNTQLKIVEIGDSDDYDF